MNALLTIPNLLTLFRIAGAVSLIFIDYSTTPFFIIYFLSGLSDALDGFIARATNSVTLLGSKLDSIADISFYAVMCFKVLNKLIKILPIWLWISTFAVISIRISAYVVAAVKFKKFASIHTYLNKATGLALFFLPYVLTKSFALVYCICACAIALLGSLEELLIHALSKCYIDRKKSIFIKETDCDGNSFNKRQFRKGSA